MKAFMTILTIWNGDAINKDAAGYLVGLIELLEIESIKPNTVDTFVRIILATREFISVQIIHILCIRNERIAKNDDTKAYK
jgi:hypothetical protein